MLRMSASEIVPEGLTIRRASTAEQVADALRGLMMRGELQPGTRLREVPLATSLGVSRNTVREAIRVLVHERLVTHTLHRGAVVARPTEEDVVDIFRVRRTLELAAVHASDQANAEQVAGLAEAVDEIARAVESKDLQAIAESDLMFHRRLVGLLQSRHLDVFYQNVQAELRLGVSLVDREYRDPGALVAEHQEIYDTVASGDRAAATAVLAAHLDDAERRLLRIVRERFRSFPPTP